MDEKVSKNRLVQVLSKAKNEARTDFVVAFYSSIKSFNSNLDEKNLTADFERKGVWIQGTKKLIDSLASSPLQFSVVGTEADNPRVAYVYKDKIVYSDLVAGNPAGNFGENYCFENKFYLCQVSWQFRRVKLQGSEPKLWKKLSASKSSAIGIR